MKKSRIISLLAALALLGGGTYLYSQEQAPPAETGEEATAPAAATAPAPPPPGVTFVQTSPHDLPEQYERLGVVEPSRVADVHARIEGFLSERLFEEGQHVEQGQVLYRIERDEFEAVVMVREAELRDAQARLDLARRDYERTLNLSKTGAVAQERLDETEIERDRASAAVARAEAALREARLELGYTEIEAPVSGIVEKAISDEGDLVDNSGNSLLTTITRISPVYVTYGISEADYVELRENGDVDLSRGVDFKILLRNGELFDETGTLNYQSPEFEPSTGMLRVRIAFPNEDGFLLPNQFVKIIEDHGVREDVLTVPKQSVIQTPGGSAVFVIDENNTLQFRPVVAGEWHGDNWIIASGLQPGERVMVEGLMKSAPGAPVHPTPYTPEAAE